MTHFLDLPKDMTRVIRSHLGVVDRFRLRGVCRQLHADDAGLDAELLRQPFFFHRLWREKHPLFCLLVRHEFYHFMPRWFPRWRIRLVGAPTGPYIELEFSFYASGITGITLHIHGPCRIVVAPRDGTSECFMGPREAGILFSSMTEVAQAILNHYPSTRSNYACGACEKVRYQKYELEDKRMAAAWEKLWAGMSLKELPSLHDHSDPFYLANLLRPSLMDSQNTNKEEEEQ
jgi:hypothetical protein